MAQETKAFWWPNFVKSVDWLAAKEKVYRSYIPRNVKLSESPSRGQTIFEYDVRCDGAKAYAGLASEVVKQNEKEVKYYG